MDSDDPLSYNGIPYVDQFTSNATLGPAMIGFLAQFFLYGVFISLFFNYISSRNYRHDPLRSRVLIWTVVALNSISTALNAYLTVYHGTDQDRGLLATYQITVPDRIVFLPGVVIAVIVQVFLALRASQLFKHRPLVKALFLSLIGALVLFSLVPSVMMPMLTWAYEEGWEGVFGNLTYNELVGIWLWLSAGVDVILTATLVVCLRRAILGFNKNTDSAIRAVMRTAVLSAAPTVLFAVGGALLSVGWGAQNNVWSDMFLAAATPLTGLYSLSLLNTLSSRRPLKRQRVFVGSSTWLSSAQKSAEKVSNPVRPSLAARTISKMSIPSINLGGGGPQAASPGLERGISFTRDVVEQVEVSEDAPRRDRRPYLESYGDGERREEQVL